MANKKQLIEGQIYAVPLSNGTYTVAQLVNKHLIAPSMSKSENTFAFYNIIYPTLDDLIQQVQTIDMSNPIAILTANSSPKTYKWISVGIKEINIKFNYKQDITTLGLFRNRSTDPSLLLEPYFGLFPWDGYAVDNWIEDKYLLPNANIREDIKFIHDFTIDELSKLLPPNSPKLMKLRSDLKENK